MYKLLTFLLIASFCTAQDLPPYAFNYTSDSLQYEEGETFYLSYGVYKKWTEGKFMYGFYESLSTDINQEKKHITEPIYQRIQYQKRQKGEIAFYKIKLNDKWGLLRDNRNVWIKAMYDKINFNSHVKTHYISVQLDGRFGLLKPTGETILAPIYDDILFDGYHYKVFKDDMVGIIDKDGQTIIPICFDNILYNKKYHLQIVKKGAKWSVFNWIKEQPCEPSVHFDDIRQLNQFYICRDDDKYGILDTTGNEIAPFEYDYLDPFFYSFTDGVIAAKNKKVGLLRIDSSGIIHTRIPIAYDDIWVEQETFKLKVKSGSKTDYYFIDAPLFNLNYNEVQYFPEIEKFTVKSNGKWGLINVDEEILLPIKYQKILLLNSGMLLVRKNDRWGLFSTQGKELIPCQFDEFDYRDDIKSFFVKKKGLWGISTLRGGVVLPPKYEDLYALSNKKFLVKQKGKWGIVGAGGFVIVPCDYDTYSYKYKSDQIILRSAKGDLKKYRLN